MIVVSATITDIYDCSERHCYRYLCFHWPPVIDINVCSDHHCYRYICARRADLWAKGEQGDGKNSGGIGCIKMPTPSPTPLKLTESAGWGGGGGKRPPLDLEWPAHFRFLVYPPPRPPPVNSLQPPNKLCINRRSLCLSWLLRAFYGHFFPPVCKIFSQLTCVFIFSSAVELVTGSRMMSFICTLQNVQKATVNCLIATFRAFFYVEN
jgi:hypothetical protein